jgi:predicted cobalt transporter CbtA
MCNMSRYLRSGALAGLAAGLASGLLLVLLGERSINDAIALERAGQTGPHDEVFSRGVQQIGGVLGVTIVGVCLGVVFAVVFVAVRHRLSGTDDWRRSAQLAAVAFVTITLVPFLKYPGNPPAVGDPDTITRRTVLFAIMLAWSCVATFAAFRFSRFLQVRQVPNRRRFPATGALYVVLVAVALALLPPSPDTVGAPATLIWRFRIASLGGSALFWSVLGVAFGWVLLRAHSRATPTIESRVTSAASSASDIASRVGRTGSTM